MVHKDTNYHNIDILAKTIYGEARGEYHRIDGGLSSLIAVANVIKNRSMHPERYGQTIAEICLRPYQFSCWNVNDPNYAILQNLTPNYDDLFTIALEVAQGVLYAQWPDLTQGANHYHTKTMKIYPKWAENLKPIWGIGNHLFYKL